MYINQHYLNDTTYVPKSFTHLKSKLPESDLNRSILKIILPKSCRKSYLYPKAYPTFQPKENPSLKENTWTVKNSTFG
jgi:hypothetical protein